MTNTCGMMGQKKASSHSLVINGDTNDKNRENFMSFCLILSTLCRQVVFHIVPHFGKRAGQKVQRKIAAAVQKVKSPLLLSRYFEISETNCQQSFFLF
jgi:hypothetical protein